MRPLTTRSRSPPVRGSDHAEPHLMAGRPYYGSEQTGADQQSTDYAHSSLQVQGERNSVPDQRRTRENLLLMVKSANPRI